MNLIKSDHEFLTKSNLKSCHLEWVNFQHRLFDEFLSGPWLWNRWDRATLQAYPAPHMIVDCNGRGLKLRDIRTGMCVKILIRGNEVRYPGYQYLYGAVGSSKYSVKLNGNPRQYNIVTLLYFPNNLM